MRKRLSVCGYCAIQLPLLKEYPCVCTQSLRRGQALSAAGRKIQPALQADSAYSHMYAQMGNKLPEHGCSFLEGHRLKCFSYYDKRACTQQGLITTNCAAKAQCLGGF